MQAVHLNEHDANQGAQSSGEFLGMTGNSGWYLLGSSGATILMVIFLWGILGVSLLFCLLVGVILCGLSMGYVFALKNNRPRHYDTDFFESVLVEAGVVPFRFGPRSRPPVNPFTAVSDSPILPMTKPEPAPTPGSHAAQAGRAPVAVATTVSDSGSNAPERREKEEVVTRNEYERLREELVSAEELLDDALAERAES